MDEKVKCDHCNGKGRYKRNIDNRSGDDGIFVESVVIEVQCPKCKGAGVCDWVTNAMAPKGPGIILSQSTVLSGAKIKDKKSCNNSKTELLRTGCGAKSFLLGVSHD